MWRSEKDMTDIPDGHSWKAGSENRFLFLLPLKNIRR
jgi:hypothetical protein